jgi:hypothetical protein
MKVRIFFTIFYNCFRLELIYFLRWASCLHSFHCAFITPTSSICLLHCFLVTTFFVYNFFYLVIAFFSRNNWCWFFVALVFVFVFLCALLVVDASGSSFVLMWLYFYFNAFHSFHCAFVATISCICSFFCLVVALFFRINVDSALHFFCFFI